MSLVLVAVEKMIREELRELGVALKERDEVDRQGQPHGHLQTL